MSNIFQNPTLRHGLRATGLAALALACFAPAPARAWVSFGVALPPVVVAPAPVAPYPYAYPPPPYYPPAYPPGYYPPPALAQQPPPQQQAPAESPAPQVSQNQVIYGATCYAGNYTCAAAPYSPQGSGCACPGLGAPSYGTVQ